MEFQTLVSKRYSVRAYQSQPVEEAKLQQVLEAACLAPTAANRQPFQLIVVQTNGRKKELQQIYDKPWFLQAPLVIFAVGVPSQGWVRADGTNYTTVDVAIAMDHLILAATELGLGTCWIASLNIQATQKALELPPDVVPVACTPLGYPADQLGIKERKPLSALVRYEHW
jgi:nitroreductase